MKYGFLFGAGAEVSYGLPSGGKFALDIFRFDTSSSKKVNVVWKFHFIMPYIYGMEAEKKIVSMEERYKSSVHGISITVKSELLHMNT